MSSVWLHIRFGLSLKYTSSLKCMNKYLFLSLLLLEASEFHKVSSEFLYSYVVYVACTVPHKFITFLDLT